MPVKHRASISIDDDVSMNKLFPLLNRYPLRLTDVTRFLTLRRLTPGLQQVSWQALFPLLSPFLVFLAGT